MAVSSQQIVKVVQCGCDRRIVGFELVCNGQQHGMVGCAGVGPPAIVFGTEGIPIAIVCASVCKLCCLPLRRSTYGRLDVLFPGSGGQGVGPVSHRRDVAPGWSIDGQVGEVVRQTVKKRVFIWLLPRRSPQLRGGPE